MRRVVLRVVGKVQGVNFRWYVQQLAKKYDLKGYVKNLEDGSVEVVCEYDEEKPYRMFLKELEKGYKDQLVNANIESITVEHIEKITEPKYSYFEVKF